MKILFRLAIVGWIICFIPLLVASIITLFGYWLITGRDSMTVMMDWWQDILDNLLERC